MKCPKKYAKEGFLSDEVFILISNTPKSKEFCILYFLLENWSRVLYIWNASFLLNLKCLKCTIFLIWFLNWENRHFQYFEYKKVGHFEFKARYQFSNNQRTEIEKIRFWGISNKNTNAIAWKIPLYICFGAYSPCSLLIRLLRFWAISN